MGMLAIKSLRRKKDGEATARIKESSETSLATSAVSGSWRPQALTYLNINIHVTLNLKFNSNSTIVLHLQICSYEQFTSQKAF
jgi:hypothetical protein